MENLETGLGKSFLESVLPNFVEQLNRHPDTNIKVEAVSIQEVIDAAIQANNDPLLIGIQFAIQINKSLHRKYPQLIANHHRRVGILAFQIAQQIGMPQDEALQAALAGFIHDTGKISLPKELLAANRIYTPTERRTVRIHVDETRRLLAPIIDPEILTIAAQHHEHLDGSGYPLGISGEFTMPGQVVAVADKYDAMTDTARTYTQAKSAEEAISILWELSRRDKVSGIAVETLTQIKQAEMQVR